jgi:RNA recognition motif-containing protein
MLSSALGFGNMAITLTSNDLYDVFKQFGDIESARVLTQKNCAFVNFKYLESAIRAKEHVQTTNLLGPNTRIGFAKVPTASAPGSNLLGDHTLTDESSDPATKLASSESRELMKAELLDIVKMLAPEEAVSQLLSEGKSVALESPATRKMDDGSNLSFK